MATGDLKPDPRPIISAHHRTYINVATGQRRWQDYALLDGVPVVIAALLLWKNVDLATVASVGLLTVSGLLSAFLFGLMLQVADRAATWADSAPERGRATSDHATYLAELAANAGYASLVSILTSVAFVVASTSHGWVLRVAAALGLGLGSHLVLTLLMVMKRVFNLTLQRLRIARTTGPSPRDHPPGPSPIKRVS
jgi:hypothetical protein